MTQLVQQLQTQVDQNLIEQDIPQEFLTPELGGILIEILIEFLTSCIGRLGKQSVAERMHDPGPYQKMALKREIRRAVYDGSWRKYRIGGGNKVRTALLQVSTQSTPEQCMALIEEVETEVPGIDYDMG